MSTSVTVQFPQGTTSVNANGNHEPNESDLRAVLMWQGGANSSNNFNFNFSNNNPGTDVTVGVQQKVGATWSDRTVKKSTNNPTEIEAWDDGDRKKTESKMIATVFFTPTT